jgi:restriction system protein
LGGGVSRDSGVGIFVTSGRFSSDAEKFARESDTHIKLINFEGLIGFWQEFYTKLTDEDKNLLPLHPIYFLGSND